MSGGLSGVRDAPSLTAPQCTRNSCGAMQGPHSSQVRRFPSAQRLEAVSLLAIMYRGTTETRSCSLLGNAVKIFERENAATLRLRSPDRGAQNEPNLWRDWPQEIVHGVAQRGGPGSAAPRCSVAPPWV